MNNLEIRIKFNILPPNGKDMKDLILVKGVHKREIPKIGRKFEDYEIISEQIATDESNKKSYWLVKCKCGNENFVRSDILKSNTARKCRICSNKEKFIRNVNLGKMHSKNFSPNHQGIGELSRMLYSHYKRGAKRRNIEFKVSIEDLWDLYKDQNGKCNLTGEPIFLKSQNKNDTITYSKNGYSNLDFSKFNASLDRKDSNYGYVLGNIQWVLRRVNMIKNDLSQDEFLNLCKKITNYANQQPS